MASDNTLAEIETEDEAQGAKKRGQPSYQIAILLLDNESVHRLPLQLYHDDRLSNFRSFGGVNKPPHSKERFITVW